MFGFGCAGAELQAPRAFQEASNVQGHRNNPTIIESMFLYSEL